MENGEMFNQNRINGQKWKTDKKVRFCSESFFQQKVPCTGD